MSSPVEIADRMSENQDNESVIALDDRLRDNVRQSIREARDAKAGCPSRASRVSPTRRSLQIRLIFHPRTNQFFLVLFTILVIVYSSTRPIIATVTSSTPTTRTKLLDTERAATTEAAHHHVEYSKPTTLVDDSTPRGSNLNSKREPEGEGAKVSPSVRLPTTNIKINRTRRSSDTMANGRQRTSSSPVNMCSDCLAIPMVALVGHKQVNGFLLHPAPANLQRHKSMAPSSSPSSSASHYAPNTGSHTLSGGGNQQSGIAVNRARGVHDNHHDHNISHYGERTSQSVNLIGQPVSSHGVPLSTHGAHHYDNRGDQAGYTRHTSESQPTMNNRHYHQYQQVAYEQVVTSSPFEPKSDEKCPMTGPLTVCDQINSYPADAIVHRVAAAKRALHKAYFDIDSLFSDEGDGFTEPFSSTPTGAANSSSGGGGGGGRIMMPMHPEHDNMTAALDVAAHPATRQHHDARSGYYQSTASKKAYQAYDQQTSSNGGGGSSSSSSGYSGERQEQIEVNNQRAFAKRAHVSSPSLSSPKPALLEGGRGGGSSGESLDTPADARPPYAHNSGVQRRQRSSSLPSTASLSGQRTNIGTPDDFLEHQTRPSRGDDSGEFLYLVERRGLTISGHHQMTVAGHREDSNPSDGGRGGGMELDQYGSNPRQARQIMDRQQQQQREEQLLSLDAADSAPLGSSVKSEIHKSKERPSSAGQPSATVAGSTPDAGTASDTVTETGDVLQSPGTISAPTTLRLIPDIASEDDAQRRPAGKQTKATTSSVLARASHGDDDGANSARDQLAPATISRSSSGQATNDTFRQRRDRLKAKFDLAADTREATLSTQPKLSDQTIKRADAGKRPSAAGNDRLSSTARLLGGGGGQQLRSASAIEHKSGQFVQLSHSPNKHPLRSRRGLAAAKSSLANFSRDAELAKIKLSHSDEQRQAAGLAPPIDRFKRQVPPIQVDRTSPTAPTPNATTTTTSTEELVDPERAGSTSVADDQPPAPQPICRAKSIYISPKAAMNHKKQWKYVVNAPERDPRIKQIIRVDICEAPFEPCSSEVILPLGFTSQCKQKYAKKKLLALDARSGLLEVDTFFIPSCCVCQLIPASARFSDLPSSSSSPSSIDDEASPPITSSRENNNEDDESRSSGSSAPAGTNDDDSRAGGRGEMTAGGDAGSSVNGDNVDNNGNASDNSNEGR